MVYFRHRLAVIRSSHFTCQSLETVQFEDISLQHLDPGTADFRGQLGANGEQPGTTGATVIIPPL